jgi:hypothetical protein
VFVVDPESPSAASAVRSPERRRERDRERLRRGLPSEPEGSSALDSGSELAGLEPEALERLRDLDRPRDPDAVLGVDSGGEAESWTPEPKESPPMMGAESEL